MAVVNPALGTTLGFDQTTPGTYVTLGNVMSIGSDREFGSVETTNLGSTKKTYRATILDGGEISFEVELDPGDSAHAALETSFLAGTTHLWKITYTDTAHATDIITGFITKYSTSAGGPEENLTASFTVKADGTTIS